MIRIDRKNVTALELLDLSIRTAHYRFQVDWFRAIHHYDLPNSEWHAHSSFELHFMKEGKVTFQYPDGLLELKAGEALLIPADFPHKLDNPSYQLYFRYIFSAEFEHVADDPEAEFLANALNVTTPTVIPLATHLIDLLDNCLVEAQEKAGGYLTIIESNLLVILTTLARELSQSHPASYHVREKKTMDKTRMEVILPLLEEAANGNLRVEDIAARVHLSPRQLQRTVHAQTGMTPKQLMMRHRLQNAKELLKDPDLTVSAIAQHLGFSSEQSFSRFFQQMNGEPPLAYRNGAVPKKMSD